MKIYITRHGETEWNKIGRMQGWQNSNLTEKGEDNARKLSNRLEKIEFDCIYCSPLGRAVQTADIIRGKKDTEIIYKENLKEMCFGIWEGMHQTEVIKLYKKEHHNFWKEPHRFETMEGESFEEIIARTKIFLKEICESKYENVLVVTHTILIKSIYAILKNYEVKDFWNPPFMYDTCLTILEVNGDKIEFLLEGDTSHLDEQCKNIRGV